MSWILGPIIWIGVDAHALAQIGVDARTLEIPRFDRGLLEQTSDRARVLEALRTHVRDERLRAELEFVIESTPLERLDRDLIGRFIDGAPSGRQLDATVRADIAQAVGDAIEVVVPAGEDPRGGPALQPELEADAEVLASFRAVVLRQNRRAIEALDERTDAFVWNGVVSKRIFWVVHAVLLVGLAAATWEFFVAARRHKDAAAAPTEVKVSLDEIALKTALHGVVLFALSIGFYFLFLKFVYPIQEVAGP